MKWQPIETAPKDGTRVDLWLRVHASPRSFGFSDAFRVPEGYFQDGVWGHSQGGSFRELYQPYITHWMPLPEPPEDL